MAELGFTYASSSTVSSSSNLGISRRTLIRTDSTLPANSTISFNSPGVGWTVVGDSVTFSGSTDFINSAQYFHNGQLIHPGESSSADNDVYYVNTTSFAFEFPIVKNDVIQIWQFTTSSG